MRRIILGSVVMALPGAALAAALSAQTLAAPAQQPAARQQRSAARADAADAATEVVIKTIAMQVALDRAGFSPGAIDGANGPNTRRAIDVYVQQHGAPPAPAPEPLTRYVITDEDASGPFVTEIPTDLMKQAELPTLAYTSVLEMLAERFHTVPQLLRRLNPRASFAAGEEVLVPHVVEFTVPERRDVVGTSGTNRAKPAGQRATEQVPPLPKPDVVVTVSKSAGALLVRDEAGRVIFYAPVTTGSEHDPLPIGEWKVTGVSYSPRFNYNPALFWDADPSHAKARIPPGPNNPVGVVWIDLSKDHYGIHGTPEPASVGKTTSHGCVRLTNWDVAGLASLVSPGTRVVFSQ